VNGGTQPVILHNDFSFFVDQNLTNKLIFAVMEGCFEFAVSGIEGESLINEVLCEDIVSFLNCDMQCVSLEVVHG
jgi:hypothetical protein